MINKVEICGVNTADLKVLAEEEKTDLIRRSQAGDQAAREKFIRGNLKLVLSVVQRFCNRGEDPDDLFQVGCVGLIKAVNGFDEERGLKFSTYAVPVILGEMKRLFRDGGTVKVSRSLKELSLRVTREQQKLSLQLNREATLTEIAEALSISPEAVADAINVSLPAISLTASDDEETGKEIDVKVESPEESVTDRLSLRSLLMELDPKDRKLLILRYYKGKTQTETARELGMTQVQVSRREKKLLLFLRGELLKG